MFSSEDICCKAYLLQEAYEQASHSWIGGKQASSYCQYPTKYNWPTSIWVDDAPTQAKANDSMVYRSL